MSICPQLVQVQAPTDEDDQVAVLLKTLTNTAYANIVTILKEKDPIPKLVDVINSLQDEERKLHKEPTHSQNNAYFVSNACQECGKSNHTTKELENDIPYLAIYVLKHGTPIDQRVLITCVNKEAKPG